jgi:translation initiation factor eIF-2B subunit alpha
MENSLRKISSYTERFVRDNSRILVFGSMGPIDALILSASKKKRFSVYLPSSSNSPDSIEYKMYQSLVAEGIKTTLIPVASVAHFMDTMDMVLVGCEAVTENGGIINTIGTYQVAILAQIFKKPMYVIAESYKFLRVFPLNQRDLPASCRRQQVLSIPLEEKLCVDAPMYDYTPPSYISLLITDLGVLTPVGVSEELIKLYL